VADRHLCARHWGVARDIGQRGASEQLLHGEPHPGNLMRTKDGLLFVDLETCCRGPVEFDVAHAPEEVGEQYPELDQDLLRDCRILVLAMITAWRWDRRDQLPDGRSLGIEWLNQLRVASRPSRGLAAARPARAAGHSRDPGQSRGRDPDGEQRARPLEL